MKVPAKVLVVAVILTAAATWYATRPGDDSRPLPHERPALRFVVKWAKSLLWLAMFADPPPETQPEQIRQEIGDDGYPQLAHVRSL